MAKRRDGRKVYLIYVTGGETVESYMLAEAAEEDFMGMRCVRGVYTSPSPNFHFISDRVTHIPCDRIQLVVEYDSYEAYKEAVKRHYDEKSK